VPKLYIAVDGDDVGHHLEYLMLTNDPDALARFAADYKQTMDWLVQAIAETFDASVVFGGGDSLLVSLDKGRFSSEELEKIRASFANRVGQTLSIGIGHTSREAYFALKLAKTSGKNCIRLFEELGGG
jgi:GTP cyclohydrolase III